jgi:ketosteroid isomerase-like protein
MPGQEDWAMIDIISGTEPISSSETTGGMKAVVGTFLVVALAAAAAGGVYWFKTQNKPATVVDPQSIVAAVKAADTQWSKAAEARNILGVMSFYADGASILPPNAEMVSRTPDMRKVWTDMLTPATTLTWTPGNVEVAASGEIAYDEGFYLMTTKVAKGKPVLDRGKYLTVWKKQADGSWKAIADMWSSDLPAPAAKKK